MRFRVIGYGNAAFMAEQKFPEDTVFIFPGYILLYNGGSVEGISGRPSRQWKGGRDPVAIIGIDLGTTNSLVSVYRNGHAELLPNEWGEFMTPSCVGVLEDGTVTVGAVAKERLITHPEETAASFKTWMGLCINFYMNTTMADFFCNFAVPIP